MTWSRKERLSEGARQQTRAVPEKVEGVKGTGGEAGKSQGSTVEAAEDGRMQRQVDVLSKMMLHLLESQQCKDEGEKMEAVKPGVKKLPTLQELTETAPIDYADWLTLIEPVMTDLSDGSHVWWRHVLDDCSTWYAEYVKLRPLQRTSFEIEASEELKKTRWVRVEHRAVSMLMEAIPTAVQEELVATKSLSPLKVIAKLMTIYQPGGVHERTVILRQLEDPGEAANVMVGVQSLRKLLRWLRRAQDVGLCLPDSTILLRGLTRLMKKLLNQNPEWAFRTSLIRNTLQLDTIPSHQAVRTYSEHLLAMELQQGGRTLKVLPSFAEENLWLINDTSLRDEGEGQGLVLIYVGDMLIMSNREIANMVEEKIQKTWEVTKPQWVTETEPVRFCGIEIYKNKEGD